MLHYWMIFIITAIISFGFTPVSKKIAYKIGAIDVPRDERRVHKKPIPRAGGIAIYVAFVVASLYFSEFDIHTIGIVAGGGVIIIAGLIDDVKSLRPIHKLMFQIAAAIILVFFNINVTSITIPFVSGGSISVGFFGTVFTMIWVVGITNAVNLIDGLDGLACGICLISALTLFGVSIISGRSTAVLLTIILAGACLGFLPFNFNPASIFMGDTGAQFLGFALAAISIEGAIKSATAVVVAVPILALGLPIYDTLFAMIRRSINQRPIMEADKGHLHHRLLDMGLTQRQVVLIMYLISVCLGATALIAMRISTKSSFALLIVVCSVILSFGIELGIFSRKSKNHKEV